MKRSSLLCRTMDCFASLAMTWKRRNPDGANGSVEWPPNDRLGEIREKH